MLDGNHAEALASLRAWAPTNGMATVRQNTMRCLSSVRFNTLDGTSTMEVQLMDPNFKPFLNTKVDFSVSNLQLERSGVLPRLALRKPEDDPSGSVDFVCSEIVSGPATPTPCCCWTCVYAGAVVGLDTHLH